MTGKLIIMAAPSGCGKSTILKYLQQNEDLNLHFSVSCTCREPREGEVDGVSYYFIPPDEFRQHIDAGDFIEYEILFNDKMYGTLRSEVDKRLEAGENVIFDVDVKGAMNIKKAYGRRALSLFIMPPSIAELRSRLEGRGTETKEVIDERISRAEYEISRSDEFDEVVVNDILEVCQIEVESLIEDFLDEE